jgi:hypothetical protein
VNIPTLLNPKIKNNVKFLDISLFNFMISLKVKGNRINQTRSHRRKDNVYGGIFSIDANLPIVKFPAQNNVAKNK